MATQWTIDPYHSEVQFKVKHLVISTVTGNFNTFSASMQSEGDDFAGASVEFSADIDSISTNNAQRDGHLKSDDFFNAEKYPKLSFQSTAMQKNADGSYTLSGNITIRETTLPIDLSVEYGGTMTDPYGNVKAGFEIQGKLNRKNFGLNWSAITEAGGVVVGDEVKLIINAQMVKQA
ncbi:MAG: YceI family protein [Microscillaceae bacterium]|jgi:polyisoprenoid-binding protein YceI|nr:YceI family protein [Microscillaceae bacterium]